MNDDSELTELTELDALYVRLSEEVNQNLLIPNAVQPPPESATDSHVDANEVSLGVAVESASLPSVDPSILRVTDVHHSVTVSQEAGTGQIPGQEAGASLTSLRYKAPKGVIAMQRSVDHQALQHSRVLPAEQTELAPKPILITDMKMNAGEVAMEVSAYEATLDEGSATAAAQQQAELTTPSGSAVKLKRSRPYTHGLPRGSKDGSLPPLDVVSKLRTLLPSAPVPVKESPPRLRTLLPAPSPGAPTPIVVIRQASPSDPQTFIIDGTLQAQGGGAMVITDADPSSQVRDLLRIKLLQPAAQQEQPQQVQQGDKSAKVPKRRFADDPLQAAALEEYGDRSHINDSLMRLLPKGEEYKYRVRSFVQMESPSESDAFSAVFTVNMNTRAEFATWKQLFEAETGSQYTVAQSFTNEGKYVDYKQALKCHHNVQRGKLGVHKHTACPSKLLVTILAIPMFRKNKAQKVDALSRCKVSLSWNHNHPLHAADVLRHRRALPETEQKLLELFQHGHSPASALACLRMDLEDTLREGDTLEGVLADRALYPDYKHCHYLLRKHCRETWGTTSKRCKDKYRSYEKLAQFADELNRRAGEACIATELLADTKVVVAVCLPFMRRVHECVEEASESVYVDSSESKDRDGYRIFLLMTHSKAGVLPLAVGMTTCETVESMTRMFALVKELLPEHSFHFRGKDLGPSMLMVYDSPTEQTALQNIWPQSHLYLTQFRVLQAQWTWLTQATNGIDVKDRPELFDVVKKLIYADTVMKLDIQCELFNVLPSVATYANFREYVGTLYETKENWCSAFRLGTVFRTRDYLEASSIILKDQIFQATRSFTFNQMVHFMTDRFPAYYQRRAMDFANNTISQRTSVRFPPYEGQQVLEHSEDIYEMMSSKSEGTMYMLNTATAMCTCHNGSVGKLCKHLHYMYAQKSAANYHFNDQRELMYVVSSGEPAPAEWLQALQTRPTGQLSSYISSTIPHNLIHRTATAPTAIPTDDSVSEELLRQQVEFSELWKAKIVAPAKRNPAEFVAAFKVANETLRAMYTGQAALSTLYGLGKTVEEGLVPARKHKQAGQSRTVAEVQI